MKHTPTPWKVGDPVKADKIRGYKKVGRHIVYVPIMTHDNMRLSCVSAYTHNNRGETVGNTAKEFSEDRVQPSISDDECLANAALIVTAVNAHSDLVKAIQNIEQLFIEEKILLVNKSAVQAREQWRAALNAAGVQL